MMLSGKITKINLEMHSIIILVLCDFSAVEMTSLWVECGEIGEHLAKDFTWRILLHNI